MSSMTLSKESADAVIPVERQAAAELDTLYVGLVRDYHRRIYNYVFRIVGDSALAEDLTQEAYLRAYRGLPKLDGGANHRAWLFRIATNVATDELRRRKRRPRMVFDLVKTLRASTRSEDERLGRICIDDAMMRIAPHHRAVLMLFEFSELSAPQVAEVLGITPEAARKRRQRAREALARVFEDERP
ncbi:MAG: sigma-70 family RNA polymerase sigma factor [Caldilineae bacterium]|nr:sigma-70 family RNA polymerase sigma factor [Caldilineae bacterium]